ncbi:MAG: hypothetical protein NT065_01760, partial [Chlamydiae bacterium]|nr:hypothetical protein [Chlamydiota bacterium]
VSIQSEPRSNSQLKKNLICSYIIDIIGYKLTTCIRTNFSLRFVISLPLSKQLAQALLALLFLKLISFQISALRC